MSSVADFLRQETDRDVSRLSVSERVALAFELGDQAVAIFAAAKGLTRDEARRILRKNSQVGRRFSAAASLDP